MAEKKSKILHARDFEHMEDDAILTQVLADKSASETFQQSYFAKFARLYKLYRSFIDAENIKKDRSNLFIPYTFHVIETVTPKLVLSIFKSRPYVQTIPLGLDNETRARRAKKMNKLLDYQFQHKVRLVPVVTDAIKTAAIYGTAITKQSWNYQEKLVVKKRQRKILGIPIPGAYDEVLVKSAVNDDPAVTLIPLTDFFFDPAGTTIDECRYCIHREWLDVHEIKAKADLAQGAYRNIDKVIEDGNKTTTGVNNPMLNAIGYSSGANGQKGVEIWNYWMDDWVVIIANQKYVIYSGMNPYYHRRKPFGKWVDTSVPNEFYGIGEIESIESLQTELNVTRNQRIDNVSLVLNKMWVVKRAANIDTTQLISRPAGFIEVDEEGDVQELKFTDVTNSAYQEEATIKGDIDTTTGVHDTERGSAPRRRETATTMNILANAGGERFELKTLLIEEGGLHTMVNQIVWLNQQYVDRAKEVLIIGDDGTMETDTISPDELMGDWTIVAVGSSLERSVNKEWLQQQLVQLYGMVKDRPDINHQELLRSIFEAYDMKNIDRLFALQPPMLPGAGMQGMGIPGQMPTPGTMQAPITGIVNGQ